MLIGYLSPKCDTAFYFLINVRLTEGGALKFFRVWAEKPPKGYGGSLGAIAAYTVDWEAQRRTEEQAEKQKQTRSLEAAAIERLSLVNMDMKCAPFINSAATK